MADLSHLKITAAEPDPRLKVKLTTTSFRTKNGYTQQKSLYFYKKPNPEHLVNCFEEDLSNSCHGDIEDRIINLHSCKDGVYELDTCNISRDWETGYIDDWDWKLFKWED